ncbi:MAG: hypothetical protein M3R25_07095 [Bacteroidota bacterium]|nr:hypothetical protein [Bacteroidota bacterium]
MLLHPRDEPIVKVTVAAPEAKAAALNVAVVPEPDVLAPELVAKRLVGVTDHVAVLIEQDC